MLNAERTNIEEDGTVTYYVALNARQWAAWKVSDFMHTARVGDARLDKYEVTRSQSAVDKLKAEHRTLGQGRWTPPGTYIRLMLPRTEEQSARMDEDQCVDEKWYTMMSDTPDEANDHAEVIHMAWNWGGRVLIHGLGLGCVLNAVLASPEVEHVDVVEVSADVIRLVGPYYQDHIDAGRLTIHHDSCLTKKWPPGTGWTIVWHDIWSSIDEDNLVDDAEAEWGISYATMHRKFGGRCFWQGSWGLAQARWMRKEERKLESARKGFVFQWNTIWTPDERLDALIKLVTPRLLDPEVYYVMLCHMPNPDPRSSGTMMDAYRGLCQEPMTEGDCALLFTH